MTEGPRREATQAGSDRSNGARIEPCEAPAEHERHPTDGAEQSANMSRAMIGRV